jgi:EAL domain-containing protein (putative c-di-GMP-specific phosphodiesterase class I)/FixJ family two-component response regulator
VSDVTRGSALSPVDACLVVERARSGLLVVQDERVAYANAFAAELLGEAPDVTPAQFQAIAQSLVAGPEHGNAERSAEICFQHRDGNPCRAHVRAVRIEYAGRPAVLLTLLDILAPPESEPRLLQPDTGARAALELKQVAVLRRALQSGEMMLHYQPKVEMSSGQIVSAEALVRCTAPEFSGVEPSEFIALAERCGLAGMLDDWVLRRACQQLVAWSHAGLPALRIAVNLSPASFKDAGLPGRLQSILVEIGADPGSLGIELTERCAMADVAHVAAVLRQIKALGVEISLDDFGTGNSSLSCLRSLPIDVVKVDRSFVHDVTAAPESASVTRAIIKMARGLNLQVVAEGVETEAQLILLGAYRCALMQGHVFSPAVPADEFAQLLREGRRLPDRFVTGVRRARTLLLVDDEEGIVASLKRLLRRDGYNIITARSATEGLQRLVETDVDVIISDHRMPGMTGIEFLRRSKELYPDSMRLMLSGYTELQSIIDAINEGAIYKFLLKPWDDQGLRGHVADAFRQKDMADENRRLSRRVQEANINYAELNGRLERAVAKQREQSQLLEASAGSIRDVLDSLPAPAFGIDADGTLSFVNRAAVALLPASAALLGRPCVEALPFDLPAIAPSPGGGTLFVEIAGDRYQVLVQAVGGGSSTRGQLVLLAPQHLLEVS